MHETNLLEDQPIAWTPTPEVIERARLTKFMRQVGVSTWDELYEFSVLDVEKFTEEVLKFLDIKFDPPHEKLLDTANGVEFPRWFARDADTPVRQRNADTLVRTVAPEADKNDRVPIRRVVEGRWHYRGYLPHFDGRVTQFITFRLSDSLPQKVLIRLKIQLAHEKLANDSKEYRRRVEEYLDKGIGECILGIPTAAEIVRSAILHEHGETCDVISWVIMPNHAHVLLRPFDGSSLSDIMKRIKGVSARKINDALHRRGQVWQPDYFDRYIRTAKHFSAAVQYIENNPVKAGLCSEPADWPYSSTGNADTSVRTVAQEADKSVRVPTAGLNITEMCLDRWQTDEMKDQPAVIWEGEEGESSITGKTQQLTYGQLLRETETASSFLRFHGLGRGDAIGVHLPMMTDTLIALLAISRIGAIAVPVFSGYGVEAIASRMKAVGATAIITCDGFPRRGKKFDAFEVVHQAVQQCPTIRKVICVDRFDSLNIYDLDEAMYTDLEYRNHKANGRAKLEYAEPTSAEDPLIILYTSGTTGKPKGIAHTHASFPIKAAQDMAFGTDVGKGTRICWYTDIGWMMGPWLIYGALINGATICIYDGAPDYPTPDRMWEFSAKHKVEVLGISPTLVRSLAAVEDRNADTPVRHRNGDTLVRPGEGLADKSVRVPPHERHDLSSLRMFASTGEPWNPAPWWWLFEKVGNSKLPIINYSGGTEIAGGILMGNPLLPQKPCSFPAPCPGMDVDILDEDGNPVAAGKVGELVIKQPWIGMARGFWQEEERYLDTYWRRFKNIWVHGDWAMRDKDGHWFILGRSDDTLKVAGKRVGPAEVESLLVAHPRITEAAVIGVPDEAKGTAMVVFCVIAEDGDLEQLTGEPFPFQLFQQELTALVAKDMGKPLAPSKIHFVSALPKTRNAKVMRRVIRAAYLGEDAGDLSALENPQAIDQIRDLGM